MKKYTSFAAMLAAGIVIAAPTMAQQSGTSVSAVQQAQAAVCPAGKITCATWCAKYRGPAGQESCLYTHPKSCMQHFGNMSHCVHDEDN